MIVPDGGATLIRKLVDNVNRNHHQSMMVRTDVGI